MTSSTTGILSVQLYTFRDAYAADPAGTLARVADLGLRYVEPFGVGSPSQPAPERQKSSEALGRNLDKSGLRVSSAHVGAPLGEGADAVLNELELLGIEEAVISWPGEVPGFTRDALGTLDGTRRFAEAMNAAAENAARRGIRLGYHNHWWEWATLESGQTAYDALLDALSPDVFLELDAYWAKTGGQDPVTLVTRLGERVRLLHLKDGPATPEAPQVPLGDGVMDNAAIIRAAPWVKWHVLEMDRTDGDVFAEVATSAQRLVDQGLSAWE